MRNAYIIIAHHNFEQLLLLLKLLDSPNNDFFIHINKTVERPEDSFFTKPLSFSRIFFLKRLKTTWGTSAFLKAVFSGLKMAVEKGHYDYYHVLSGDDLPLKSNNEINRFLENNLYVMCNDKKTNYISCRHVDDERTLNRVRYHHLFFSQRMDETVLWGRFLRHIDTVANKLQRLINYDRFRFLKIDYHYKGSGFWSISDEFVLYLLDNIKMIRRLFFRNTVIPDECALQIMINNSPFKESLFFERNGISGNLREIVWTLNSDHPKTFTMQDLNYLASSNNLFARKFNCTIDNEIIQNIFQSIIGLE